MEQMDLEAAQPNPLLGTDKEDGGLLVGLRWLLGSYQACNFNWQATVVGRLPGSLNGVLPCVCSGIFDC